VTECKEFYGLGRAVLHVDILYSDFIPLCITEENSISVLRLPTLMGIFNGTGEVLA
jgi:hypothetical protein